MRPGDIEKMVARAITVVQMLPELESGGVERGALEVGRYLCRYGHRSIVISAGGRLVERLQEEGSEHFAWQVGRKTPVCLKYILPLRRLLVQEKVDILHLRSRLPAWIGYLAWKSLPEKLRPKLVTTFHGFYSVNAYSAVMTRGQKVIAISTAVADHIRQYYRVPQERIIRIFRGVDETEFSSGVVNPERVASLRESWDLDVDAGPVVMLPGRLTRLKGHDVFFKALAEVRSLPWTAVCVGDAENPSYAAELRSLIRRLGLENRVRLAGHCEDMPAAYLVADVVVSATSGEAEAFGRIAVEAQAMGRPVIASAHGGSLETVLDGETGRLFAPGDPQSLAVALGELLSSSALREKYAQAARNWVQQRFTVETMFGETLKVYESLLNLDPIG
ncbi:MAG: glycosyltransferase family 4 protein [Desulfobacterales bacterium]|nr:glycosyltransferase family 4 protein [Desulfobacterales bacterium]MDD3081108.1 glycosyltransferase family 4 protein [Desulfobacterales bacterium]MDD3950201.1 glycosyltransferase family 4 protein [Desulfobacterales bacterium]MDY0378436.1 glycosyltransferase family 4 protein [Desulfobacterales bacterium]